MRSAKATEVKNKFGAYLEKALVEPVMINKSGRDVAVIIAYDEYERLIALEDKIWADKARAAEAEGYLGPQQSLSFLNNRQ